MAAVIGSILCNFVLLRFLYLYHCWSVYSGFALLQLFERRAKEVKKRERRYWRHITAGMISEEEENEDGFIRHQQPWRSQALNRFIEKKRRVGNQQPGEESIVICVRDPPHRMFQTGWSSLLALKGTTWIVVPCLMSWSAVGMNFLSELRMYYNCL